MLKTWIQKIRARRARARRGIDWDEVERQAAVMRSRYFSPQPGITKPVVIDPRGERYITLDDLPRERAREILQEAMRRLDQAGGE